MVKKMLLVALKNRIPFHEKGIRLMSENWKAAIEELDTETLAAQAMAEGSAIPIAGIALALIDANVIEKDRLLSILDSLDSRFRADYEDRLAEPDDFLSVLDFVREFVAGSKWTSGQVLEGLQLEETVSFALMLDRVRKRKDIG